MIEEKQHEEECKLFYDQCYNFHIKDKNNPYYELKRDGLQFYCIYIDKNKNLNILYIDGHMKQESNACVPYNKIHYYEKAGGIHYTTDINGNYSSFGGSITGSTISKKASIISGMLLGTMGLMAGALCSHKPTQIEIPSNSFSIFSEQHKIDDRSVILNYYSDAKNN